MNTPYQRIMKAAKAGKGVRLTAQEAEELSRDDAIQTRATMDDANDQGETDEDYHGARPTGPTAT